ncbi:MAG: peptidoglycan-binding protein [Zoogloeaceae bacterium]|nr:peptidoglycan-binding protein [Zoogloeaceae bacterium]
MVSDYNSRCGSFRYRSGALESARRDVEPHRDQLLAEGASRFLPSAPVGATSSKASSRIPSKQTVQAIQSRLNALGYDAGPADGLMGRMTRAAILEFQRDAGLRGDGIASEELLNWLKTSSAN